MSATARPGEAVTIEGPAGLLEARLETPANTPSFRAVVCHPHSLHGGSMDNKVVTTLTRTCRNAGGVVLRFNFRGVGASAGEYDAGRGETGDLLAAWHWLAERYPALPGWLAGFSFGSYVAARGAGELRHADSAPAGLLLVAPPVHHYGFDELPEPGCPVTVIQGDADEVVPAEQVRAWSERSTLRPELIEFADTGHFFHGRLGDLKRQVEPRLPGTTGDN
jgi:hypothetical protein